MSNNQKSVGINLDINKINNYIAEAKENINDDKLLFDILWKIRSDIEYSIALMRLDVEDNLDFDKLAKIIRMKKSDRDKHKLMILIEENISGLDGKNNDFSELIEKIWKVREYLTILIREVEPEVKKD